MRFTKDRKHYKRSRVLLQLHLNKKLEIWEIVHHKDLDKQNDNIDNLIITDLKRHTSNHHAGLKHKTKKGYNPSNKISQEKINKIIKLHQIDKLNYSQIAKKVKVSSETTRRYILKNSQKNQKNKFSRGLKNKK